MLVTLDRETTIITTGNSSTYINLQHAARYVFARSRIRAGSRVLDVGSGVGYGAEYLSRSSVSVTGIDHSLPAVELAREWHGSPMVTFLQADATNLPLPSESYDAVISFEVIEHVPDVKGYLEEIRRVLRPGGIFLCSTPCRSTWREPADYHEREYLPAELVDELRPFFADVELLGQWISSRQVAHAFYLDLKVKVAHAGRVVLEAIPGGKRLVRLLRPYIRRDDNLVETATATPYRIPEHESFEDFAVREFGSRGFLRNLITVATKPR